MGGTNKHERRIRGLSADFADGLDPKEAQIGEVADFGAVEGFLPCWRGKAVRTVSSPRSVQVSKLSSDFGFGRSNRGAGPTDRDGFVDGGFGTLGTDVRGFFDGVRVLPNPSPETGKVRGYTSEAYFITR